MVPSLWFTAVVVLGAAPNDPRNIIAKTNHIALICFSFFILGSGPASTSGRMGRAVACRLVRRERCRDACLLLWAIRRTFQETSLRTLTTLLSCALHCCRYFRVFQPGILLGTWYMNF